MLVSTKVLLRKAQRGRYAVGAFNINNLEIAQAVVEAATKLKSPVILATSEGAIAYAGLRNLWAIACELANAPIPVAIHLDHGKTPELIAECIGLGYSSVMFDGSSLPMAENIRRTKAIVAKAHRRNVAVEAELGALSGVEDLVSVDGREAVLTHPDEAAEFVRKTGCDSLAIAIGTSHGAFKFHGRTNLDFERLANIRKRVSVPLVLHGASAVPQAMVKRLQRHCSLLGDCARLSHAHGVSDSAVQRAIRLGITKVNTDTDLRIAFTAAVRETLLDNPGTIDPRSILAPARALMGKVVSDRIRTFGSNGKR